MARRKLSGKNIRNIQKSRRTYYVTLPVETVKELGWKERQKVVVKRYGRKITVKDWEKSKKKSLK